MKITAKDILARRERGRKNVRLAVEKLAAPMPMPAGPERGSAGMPPPRPPEAPPGPGMDDPMAGPGEGQGGAEKPDVAEMVKNISRQYLGDEVLAEIQDAVMQLIGHVNPDISKDVAKDFGKFMEAAAILKANLNALLVMSTPQQNLSQLQLFPEEEPQGLKTDILT